MKSAACAQYLVLVLVQVVQVVVLSIFNLLLTRLLVHLRLRSRAGSGSAHSSVCLQVRCPSPAAVSPLSGPFLYDATHLTLLRSLLKPAQVFQESVPPGMRVGADGSGRLYEDPLYEKVVHAA